MQNCDSHALSLPLQDEIAAAEEEQRRVLRELDEEIAQLQVRQSEAVRESTMRIRGVTDLTHDKRHLEKELDSAHRKMSQPGSARRKQDEESEVERLEQLSQLQQQEVDKLKMEIYKLTRKGGHVLPPSKQAVVERLPPLL